MPEYVQGFVIPLPAKNVAAYKKIATVAKKVWMEHGALDYRETVLEDDCKKDCRLPFSKLTNMKKGETVIFAWVVYKSKKDSARVMKKVMADKRLEGMDKNMPFDMGRMTFGGFETIVKI